MFDRRVLATVDAIPSGSVMAYGDIAEFLGEGTPRMVARVMSTKSDPDTPWHRVLKSDGRCAPEVALRQLALLRGEETAFTPSRNGGLSDRINLAIARWNPPSELISEPTDC